MVKYIDAEKLKAEIERLYDGEAPKHDQQCDFDDGYFTGIGTISKFIDALQQEQPEIDLEKEYKEYVEDDPVFSTLINRNVGLTIAKHFHELRLKAK